MQIVRTIIWILLAVFVAVFVMINFGEPQRVKIWPSEDPIGFDWPVGIIALVFWLLGMLPMWIYHRSVKWTLNRRIRSLENSVKSNALSQRHQPSASASAATSQQPAVAQPVGKPAENPAEPGDILTPNDGEENEKP